MPLQFCIDFGNTLVKSALFENRTMRESHRFTYNEALTSLENLRVNTSHFKGNYSAVRSLPAELSNWLETNGFEQVTTATKSPVTLDYETPETLGIDRYCNAIGGWALSEHQAVLIIDAGSCITYDLVNDKGEYQGGAISPGYEMRMKAMHHFTGKLPLIDRNEKLPLIGKTTRGSMMLGATQGIVAEVQGFISYFQASNPELKTILTGGNQSIFERHLENAIFAAQNLVLVGLNEVLLHAQEV